MFEIILVTKVVLFTITDTELAMFEMTMSIVNINIFKTCISVILSIILGGVVATPILLPITSEEVGTGGLVPSTIIHRYVGIFPSIADYPTTISHWVIRGHIPSLCPVVAEWFVADAHCNIVKTVFVVAVLASVASISCVLLVFVVDVDVVNAQRAGYAHGIDVLAENMLGHVGV